jgi:hypothetical protein
VQPGEADGLGARYQSGSTACSFTVQCLHVGREPLQLASQGMFLCHFKGREPSCVHSHAPCEAKNIWFHCPTALLSILPPAVWVHLSSRSHLSAVHCVILRKHLIALTWNKKGDLREWAAEPEGRRVGSCFLLCFSAALCLCTWHVFPSLFHSQCYHRYGPCPCPRQAWLINHSPMEP